jgi:hypothetical protein
MNSMLADTSLRFYAFQHPYVCTFVEALQRGGIPSLLTLENQRWRRDRPGYQDSTAPSLAAPTGPFFQYRYSPGGVVAKPYPRHNVDFERGGAYSLYNWELFFHVPLLLATRLMQDERHEEAMRWFHYIFNPTTASNDAIPERYWVCKPLRDEGKPESIKKILQKLQDPEAAKDTKDDIEAAIKDWRDHPFEPHRIARSRPGAYQKTVVMKYLDNLVAWGDKLFRRDTIESINEATQLYVLAAKLLGHRPHRVPGLATPPAQTYAEMRPELDDFSNAVVWMESTSIPQPFAPQGNGSGAAETTLSLPSLYFCIPHNDSLLRYWDTVADRLFKIRHCMNIEGVVRELPLFEPAIDPALLVRARAMGLDLATVLDDLSAPAPHYRFSFMLQKAREFCEELKQLGGLLLSALEKRDGEALGQLRATHEKALLKAVLEVRKQQIKEAEHTLASLERGKELAQLRKQHYQTVSQRLPGEKEFLDRQVEAVAWQITSQMAALQGSMAAAATPDITISAAGQCSGTHTKPTSGPKVGIVANLVSTYLGWLGQIASLEGTTASYKAGLLRAQQDRDLQINLAEKELEQYEKQILAADIRRQLAERELENHELQIEQAEKTDEFLRDKFTSQDLYGWMSSQVSAVYFQAYRLAYDMAKRAERAFRMELGIEDSSFVQFGAWDSLRKGLLAGEKLSLDLRRLEAAYLDQHKRSYELTRHVSLAQLDPEALVLLRVTGTCEVEIPEALFDLDYPSHYMRRIKSVSMTIPSVTGPYTSVSCTLTLLKHRIRRDTKEPDGALDPQFGMIQSIATSSGRSDFGLFELNFRDERRLPFEGAGVISTWRIELPSKVRQFDYDTISDVILHINYTALEGGGLFKKNREGLLKDNLNALVEVSGQPGLATAFSLRHDFPNEWHSLRQGDAVSLTFSHDRLPYFASVLNPKLQENGAIWLTKSPPPQLKEADTPVVWAEDEKTGLSTATSSIPSGSLPLTLDISVVDPGDIKDLLLVVSYTVTI